MFHTWLQRLLDVPGSASFEEDDNNNKVLGDGPNGDWILYGGLKEEVCDS